MSVRAIIVVMLAIMSGGSAAVLVRQLRAPAAQASQQVETVPVLVASVQIDARTRISEALLTTANYPKSNLPQDAVLPDDKAQAIGQFAMVPIFPGEPIIRKKIGPSGSPADQIAAGKVAYSISTPSAEASMASLLVPGDRINLLFSPNDNRALSRALTIMRNMRILAINTRLLQRREGEEQGFEQVRTITLEVTDAQAETLAWVQKHGSMSVTLQSTVEDLAGLSPDPSLREIQEQMGLVQPAPAPTPAPAAVATTEEPAPEPTTVPVLVAAQGIATQTRLTGNLLKTVDWPRDHVPEGALAAEKLQDVIGQWVVFPLVAGEMLLQTKLDDRPSVKLDVGPNMVLFKIQTNIGLLFPDDRVDVIFTHREQIAAREQGSMTILTNKRVVATNDKPPQESLLRQTQFENVQSVLLEVSRGQAQLLSWAQAHGTLAIALLGGNDDPAALARDMSFDELRSALEPAPEAAAPAELADVPARPITEEPQIVSILEIRGSTFGQETLRLHAPKSPADPPRPEGQ